MYVTLIIPALNEAECIGPLLAELPAGLTQQVIVVDNGSTDDTAAAARRAGALVVRESRRGYGYACAAGAAAAQGDTLAFMDGDGSFVPGELQALLAPIRDGAKLHGRRIEVVDVQDDRLRRVVFGVDVACG